MNTIDFTECKTFADFRTMAADLQTAGASWDTVVISEELYEIIKTIDPNYYNNRMSGFMMQLDHWNCFVAKRLG